MEKTIIKLVIEIGPNAELHEFQKVSKILEEAVEKIQVGHDVTIKDFSYKEKKG